MSASGRLFRPNAESAIRSPTSNAQMNGNIMNPPRMAELGGLSSTGKRGMSRNSMGVKTPGDTIRKEPVSSGG